MNTDNNKQEPCKTFTPHPVQKFCNDCQERLENHPLTEEDVDKIKSYLKVFSEQPEMEANPKYAWIPPDCPKNRLNEYFKKIPCDKVPLHKSEGQKNRLKRLVYQIPLTDLLLEKCRFVKKDHEEEFNNYSKALQDSILKIGKVRERTQKVPGQCPKCFLILDEGELVVTTSENGGQAFHPACFVCVHCEDLLADLIHCSELDGTLYCLRHYGDYTKKRCQTCDELIFASHLVSTNNNNFHQEHLLCFNCNVNLEESKGYVKNDKIYCETCYDERFANECIKCKEKITRESRNIGFDGKDWHDSCFTCSKCDANLADSPSLYVEEGGILCKECYKEYAPKCEGCKDTFEPQSQIVTYEEKTYHVVCFKCTECKNSIGTGPFVTQEGAAYCKPCHLRNFGIRCFRCKLAITDAKALMYNKQPYHEDCFTCFNCSSILANRPFKNVEGNWYCLNCYGNTFCQKCNLCEEPILLGSNDEVMYSHEDYRWHSSCFKCTLCSNSLADVPFMMRDKVLVCTTCMSGFEEKEDENPNRGDKKKGEENPYRGDKKKSEENPNRGDKKKSEENPNRGDKKKGEENKIPDTKTEEGEPGPSRRV